MDPVEKAIRNALGKGDAGDAAFRLRVYRAAQSALDRAIGGDASLSAEQQQTRRARLSSIVAVVEAEFAPAIETPTAGEPRIAAENRQSPGPLSGERIEKPAPELDRPPISRSAANAGRPSGRPGGSRPWAARLFVAATLVAAVGLATWWAYDTGLFMSAEERDTSVPNPPARVEGEDFVPKDAGAPQKPGEDGRELQWITVFSPKDPTSVQASAGAKAEIIGAGVAQALRISSTSADAAVTFDVGEGVLAELAGGKVVFDIVARSEEGKPTQMSVSCNFAGFGDCGRKRYEIGHEQNDYLFEMAFPEGNPGGSGTISVISDISNDGKAVEIFQIRAARAASEPPTN